MSQTTINPIMHRDFEAHAALAGQEGAVVIGAALSGNADLRIKDALDVFIAALDQEAVRIGAAEVSIDLRSLQFMNSSCFKTLISWLTVLDEREPEKKYRVTFFSNPGLHWQKRSLHALSCFAADLITVSA